MIVRSFKDIENTDRHVKSASGTWESKRIVLAKENVGFSLHETVLYAGTETSMWYANHVEAVLCVEGEAELSNDETGEVHWIRPGTMYLLDGHERHTLRPKTDFRCVCVFNPPVTGREDHDENGVYPLLTEPEPLPRPETRSGTGTGTRTRTEPERPVRTKNEIKTEPETETGTRTKTGTATEAEAEEG